MWCIFFLIDFSLDLIRGISLFVYIRSKQAGLSNMDEELYCKHSGMWNMARQCEYTICSFLFSCVILFDLILGCGSLLGHKQRFTI